MKKVSHGSFTLSSAETTIEVSHDLGSRPNFFLVWSTSEANFKEGYIEARMCAPEGAFNKYNAYVFNFYDYMKVSNRCLGYASSIRGLIEPNTGIRSEAIFTENKITTGPWYMNSSYENYMYFAPGRTYRWMCAIVD